MSTPPSAPISATGSSPTTATGSLRTPPKTPVLSTPHLAVAQLNYNIRHGVNPTPQPALGQEDSIEFQNIILLHEAYQRVKLKGFTIAQLQEAGCFGGDDLRPIDLPAEIHPFWVFNRWPPAMADDIGHGFTGRWDLQGNQTVKDAMLPVLYLATMIIKHFVSWSWFDALVLGERRPVPPDECKDGCSPKSFAYEAFSFHMRQNKAPDALATLNSHMENFTSKLVLRINSRVAYVNAGRSTGIAFGWYLSYKRLKSRPREYAGGAITLASEAVLPLLRDDLSISERLLQQFLVAKTLCHESMHAFGDYIRTTMPNIPPAGSEPFFEDEIMSELGRSWENSTFGGMVAPLHERDLANFHELALGAVVSEWPGWMNFGKGQFGTSATKTRYRRHETVIDGQNHILWPLHLVFVESLQQQSYWRHEVVKYGSKALVPPRIFGFRRQKGMDRTQYVTDGQFQRWVTKQGLVLTPTQNAAQEARDLKILEAQTRADYLRAELNIQDAERKARRQGSVAALDQKELDFHVETLDECKKNRANPTIPGDDVKAWEGLDTLRSSKYPVIRCQANLELGKDVMSGDARRRFAFLEAAAAEAARLAIADPSDLTLAKVFIDGKAAMKGILAEVQIALAAIQA
ncbi:hypothetical protein BDZ45DRAFT_749282 [Acephala macrosclerotiorum]|nr:hypothetical protein BDZ45DRAFT_749282 [Acephala macrosclerotiorum]